MKAVIRQIEPGDNAAAAKMIRDVFVEFDAEREGTVFSDPTTDELFELFQKPSSILYVATVNDVLVGTCGIYPTEGLPNGCAELVKFYLNADARGLGIGKKLMEMCTDWSRKKGYSQLYIESLPVFDKAVKMYELQGYKALDAPLCHSHPGCTLWFSKEL